MAQSKDKTSIGVKSRDGITIGMIDAIITLSVVLEQRLKQERKRFKRSSDEWAYHSQPVQDALHDLASNKTVRNLLWPRDEKMMKIIHDGAKVIDEIAAEKRTAMETDDLYKSVTKDKPTKSIWDKDVDMEKVNALSPEHKHKLFPNDYDADGMPYGDY